MLFQLFITIGKPDNPWMTPLQTPNGVGCRGCEVFVSTCVTYEATGAGILVAGCINLGAKDIFPWGWRLPLAIAGRLSLQDMLLACFLT